MDPGGTVVLAGAAACSLLQAAMNISAAMAAIALIVRIQPLRVVFTPRSSRFPTLFSPLPDHTTRALGTLGPILKIISPVIAESRETTPGPTLRRALRA